MNINDAVACFTGLNPPFYTLTAEQKMGVAAYFGPILRSINEDHAGIAQLAICAVEFMAGLSDEIRAEAEKDPSTATMRKMIADLPDDHPGRNDVLIARWSFTGDLALLRELHQAAQRTDERGEMAVQAIGCLRRTSPRFVSDLAKALAAN